jgi:hypothetical protein
MIADANAEDPRAGGDDMDGVATERSLEDASTKLSG